MKKSQKRLGNKGFSLVELIVVIAIMAVLVGVLAPTLIRNVEKSRESTDLQNLDSIRTSVTTALSTENVAKNLPAKDDYAIIKYDGSAKTLTDSSHASLASALQTEMTSDSSMGTTLKSSAASKSTIYIIVDSNGKATVGAYEAVPTSSNYTTSAVDCKRNTGKLISE